MRDAESNIFEAPGGDLDDVRSYDYALPEELVAAHPAQRRDASRLLVARCETGAIEHRRFADLPSYLKPGDLLVFNNTRVVPARILTHKQTGGQVELLITDVLEPNHAQRWTTPAGGRLVLECMTRSSKPLRAGMALTISDDLPDVAIRACRPGHAQVEIDWTDTPMELLSRCGQMPLPPYIVRRRRQLGQDAYDPGEDGVRYQTVYASQPGAVAAPTAGLHFTDDLFERLDVMGVTRAFVTLQVGPGTFRPVTAAHLSEHDMHSEEYTVTGEFAEAIARTRRDGGRVIAVGTTSMRVLESEARRDQPFVPGTRRTELFLRPGEPIHVCDGLVTNFHLPKSTLLALVATFVGYEFMTRIYSAAVHDGYRFYSYGDGSLLLRRGSPTISL